MKSGWQTKSLGDLCRFIDYRGKTPEKTGSGLRLITAKNVKMGFIQTTPLEFVDPSIYANWMTRGIPKERELNKTTDLRQMGNGDIVPLWQQSIKSNGHGLFEIIGYFAFGFKHSVENRSKNG